LSDLRYIPATPTKLFNNNKNAIWLIHNPKFHKRTKHIDIQYHLIREQYQALGNINVLHINTVHHVVDMLTKTLLDYCFAKLCCLLEAFLEDLLIYIIKKNVSLHVVKLFDLLEAFLEDLLIYIIKKNVSLHVVKLFDLLHEWECCN
jgi:hypothetical protein